MPREDPRTSDEATGLPPLEEVDPADTLLLLAWHASVGVASSPHTQETVPVRYLSVRGLIRRDPDDPHSAEWAQIHIAVPVEHALDVAAALGSGGMFDAPTAPTVERDEPLTFPTPTFALSHAACRLRVIRMPAGERIAVVTEIPDNPGASVTNAAEYLFAAIKGQQYDAVIEHYPPAAHRDSTLDEVLMSAGGSVSWRPVKGPFRDTLLAVLEDRR